MKLIYDGHDAPTRGNLTDRIENGTGKVLLVVSSSFY